MLAQSEFLSQLQTQSHDAFQRRGVAIYGEPEWQDALIADFTNINRIRLGSVLVIGPLNGLLCVWQTRQYVAWS